MSTDKCFLCKLNSINYQLTPLNEDLNIKCETCGEGYITVEALEIINEKNFPIHLIQGYLRYRTDRNISSVKITTENIDSIINSPIIPKNVPEKLNMLLLSLGNMTSYGGEEIKIDRNKDYPIAFAKNSMELKYLFEELFQSKNIKFVYQSGDGNTSILILSKGWEKIESLKERIADTNQCFVAMDFSKKMKPVYDNTISKAITKSGYQPFRIDENEHVDLIPYKILSEIRRSKFVVADVTNHRNGVYLEAGFAMGLNIPVIWVCNKKDFDKTHFDIKQYNHIIYETEEDLFNKLKVRIEAVIL